MIKWELLHDLRESEREQTVIKLKVKGEVKPVIAAVDRITSTEVILKPLTLFGQRLQQTVIPLLHIERLVKFHLRYEQGIYPVFKHEQVNHAASSSVNTKKKVNTITRRRAN